MKLQFDRMAAWLAWIMLATAIFTIMPLGPHGALGWIGAAAPLAAGVLPFLRGWRLVVVAAGAMVAVVILSDSSPSAELAIPMAVLLMGVWLTPMHHGGAEPADSHRGQRGTRREFDTALMRELGRARRYGRPLTVFSISCDDRRDLGYLRTVIGAQIHIYCQMAELDGRVLVIVPELGSKSCLVLEERIRERIREASAGPASIGRASFPNDAVSGAGLVRFADANRRAVGSSDIDDSPPRSPVTVDEAIESELSVP